ncbi:cyclopropane mycolic acid synthase family methyltransferase, partial [Mycobacterium sp.]|uniref:cyclopropane mycolic acid synthase family methyltransferase n=1 Tax=Mycobacterium sp. TaxID=1785 RepID=UPI003F9B97D8
KFEMAQAHYDLSDEFFRLFQDPTQSYSCAYFEREDMTLEEAQLAKIDLSLGKLGLEPGMTLLDIGCGWGACINRALDKYDVNVIGLTLSKNQLAHVQDLLDKNPSKRSKSVQLRGWEEWDGKVDRIVSIGAFEHFDFNRYDDFFDITYKSMPADGVMLLHTITILTAKEMIAKGLPLTFELARFTKFMLDEIFPGCRLPTLDMVPDYAAKAGYTCTRVQQLQSSYVKTLDMWTAALREHKDEAIALQGEAVYNRYDRYLSGSAKRFRDGYLDIAQYTLEK